MQSLLQTNRLFSAPSEQRGVTSSGPPLSAFPGSSPRIVPGNPVPPPRQRDLPGLRECTNDAPPSEGAPAVHQSGDDVREGFRVTMRQEVPSLVHWGIIDVLLHSRFPINASLEPLQEEATPIPAPSVNPWPARIPDDAALHSLRGDLLLPNRTRQQGTTSARPPPRPSARARRK